MNYNFEKFAEVIPKNFNMIKESLERIGVINKKEKLIFPTCYIIQNTNENKFYILHFKELFLLTRDDGYNNISDEDVIRRNSIIKLLEDWGMIENVEVLKDIETCFISIIPHSKKSEYKIKHKFNLNNIK